MFTQEMKVAALRAATQAFIQFGGVFFTTYAVADLRAAILAASAAAFVALGFRGVGEGAFDAARGLNQRTRESLYAHDLNDPTLGVNRSRRD